MRRHVRQWGLFLAAAMVAVPGVTHAQLVPIPQDPSKISLASVVDILIAIIGVMLTFVSAIAAIFILISGYQRIMAAGNPEKLEKAKMALTWSIGGFILAISSYRIVLLLQQVLLARNRVSEFGGRIDALKQTPQSILADLIDLLFIFGAVTAVLYLILGGYRYITAAGNRDKLEQAKVTILYSVIGLIIVLVAVAIVTTVENAIKVK